MDFYLISTLKSSFLAETTWMSFQHFNSSLFDDKRYFAWFFHLSSSVSNQWYILPHSQTWTLHLLKEKATSAWLCTVEFFTWLLKPITNLFFYLKFSFYHQKKILRSFWHLNYFCDQQNEIFILFPHLICSVCKQKGSLIYKQSGFSSHFKDMVFQGNIGHNAFRKKDGSVRYTHI